ncbi:uncharacterized protein LOC111701125 [Eurytemora carolleeae]|uniref:uncharacterized protein LOC111701125 n=1 Tax=Eurytemora carolleeae TaxID=1294199 RepID=UPI000C7887CD|nr:uncharacterized protein LOC111701125 [Eurytemora carolleeae]XP_023328056.1 uncharacterized protein LOC111701125 [Eurytemora carolleeae]|eukprot:XP_023328055.1 uncharacterized protein LOC111701125 [Eurytemora affinis]
MCVCRPHTKVPESMCLMVALGICIFSAAINSTRFFEYELKEIPVVSYTQYENGTLESAKNESVFIPFPTDMRQHPLYSKISTVTSILLLHLVPLISLCYLNFAIFTAIR